MNLPVQVSFRHIEVSPAAESKIREEAEALGRYFDGIVSCHVTVDMPHHHQQRGNDYHLHLQIHVPGKEINVSHEPSRHDPSAAADHTDIYVCIRDAFAAARRQIEDYARLIRRDVRHHVEPAQNA